MTADTFHQEHHASSLTAGFGVFKQIFGHMTKIIGYAVVVVAYVSVFIVSTATLSLIDIRRANLKDFNALIAMLEQEERYLLIGALKRCWLALPKTSTNIDN